MTTEWSLTDKQKGARTIEEITENSTLGKHSKERYNCSHIQLFPFIPIKWVIIDTLHLFPHISDNPTDLLIRSLSMQDDLNKRRKITPSMTNLEVYEKHLNETCKIHFKWCEGIKILWLDWSCDSSKTQI